MMRALVLLAGVAIALFSTAPVSFARDNGQYAQVSPDLKKWVEELTDADGNGCCADADGLPLEPPNWKTVDSHYEVFIEKQWVPIPPRAVITKPNRLKKTVVWYYVNWKHEVVIRCFLPGPLA